MPGRGGADIGSVEECRGVPSSAGKGWGRHWGAFKLLYYHCNTTKIDGLWCRGVPRSAEECRGVPSSACGAEECRVPSSAGKGWGRHWGAFGRFVVPRSADEECRVVPGRGGADILQAGPFEKRVLSTLYKGWLKKSVSYLPGGHSWRCPF